MANYSVYSTALSLAPGTTLDAYATAEGLDNSNDMEQYTVPATPTAWTLTFANAEGATGIVPAEVNVNLGDSYTLPSNFTMYKEGYTLTGWNDGTDSYDVGASYTPTGNKTLTAVYSQNTVTLDDRTGAVTIKWGPFNQNLGIPDLHFEGNTGFVVAQATVAGSSIDVKLPIDATNGKFKNQESNNWTQVGPGTIFTIPAADGATITYKQYDAGAVTTPEVNVTTADLDDNGNYALTADGTSGSLYYEYIQVTLPALPVENVADFKFTAKADWNNSNHQTVGKITATFTNDAQSTYVKFAKGNTLTLAVTGDYVITKVEMGYDSSYSPIEGTITADKGTMNDAGTLWTGCANGLVITNSATSSNDARVNMLKVTYAPAVSTTLSSYEWTTFVSDKDLDFTNSDVKAYVVTGYTGKSINKNNDVKKVPANTPLLLNAPEGTYYIPVSDTPETITTNCLVAGTGSVISAVSGKTRYVLSLNGSSLSFMRIVDVPATVPIGKAYLEFDGEVSAPTFGFDEATSINEIANGQEPTANGQYYNLNGQRVAQPTKGLYIVNGRKVIMK